MSILCAHTGTGEGKSLRGSLRGMFNREGERQHRTGRGSFDKKEKGSFERDKKKEGSFERDKKEKSGLSGRHSLSSGLK